MYRLHGGCQSGKAFREAFQLHALAQPGLPGVVDFMNGGTRTERLRGRRLIAPH